MAEALTTAAFTAGVGLCAFASGMAMRLTVLERPMIGPLTARVVFFMGGVCGLFMIAGVFAGFWLVGLLWLLLLPVALLAVNIILFVFVMRRPHLKPGATIILGALGIVLSIWGFAPALV